MITFWLALVTVTIAALVLILALIHDKLAALVDRYEPSAGPDERQAFWTMLQKISVRPPPRAVPNGRSLARSISEKQWTRISSSIEIAPGAEVPLVVAPCRAYYFRTEAIRITAYSVEYPGIEQRVEFGELLINEVTVYGERYTFTPHDVFWCGAGTAVEVPAFILSSEQLIHPLVMRLRNPNGCKVKAVVELFGKPFDRLEPGSRCGLVDDAA